MVCLLNNRSNRELLAKYSKIMGSESAAYYVLAANNGYELEFDMNGNPSSLYTAFVRRCEGDIEEAIRRKSIIYTSKYVNDERFLTKEPSLSDIRENYDKSVMLDILGLESEVDSKLAALSRLNIVERRPTLASAIRIERYKAIDVATRLYLRNFPGASVDDVCRIQSIERRKWNKQKINDIIDKQQMVLAKAFGLRAEHDNDGNVIYTTSDNSKEAKLRVYFVNSLSTSQWTDSEGNKHKGVFVDKDLSKHGVNLIYLCLTNADPSTFTHELAHYYVRTFWESAPVQNALKEIQSQYKRNLSSKELEEKLIDTITDKTLASKSLESPNIVSKFWTSFAKMFDNVVRKVFKKNQEQYQNASDLLASYFVINEDLSNQKASDVFYEKYLGPVFQTMTDQKRKDIVREASVVIERTLKNKIKAIRAQHRNDNTELYAAESALARLKLRDRDNVADLDHSMLELLYQCNEALAEAITTIGKMKRDGVQSVSYDDFIRIKTDVIGYYTYVLKGQGFQELFGSDIEDIKYASDARNTQIQTLSNLEEEFDRLLKEKVECEIHDIAQRMIDVGTEDDVANVEHNMLLWITNEMRNGELQAGETFVGIASKSRSDIVRAFAFMIAQINQTVETQALGRGNLLAKLYKNAAKWYNKVSPVDFMKNFVETDSNGAPTGRLVSLYDSSKMWSEKNKVYDRYKKKHGVVFNSTTNRYEINGEPLESDKYRDIYIKMNDELDDVIGKYAHRRYIPEYYKTKRLYLSPENMSRERSLRMLLDKLEKQCVDEELGIPIIPNLNVTEQNQYRSLKLELEDLSNPYYIQKDSNGKIINITLKTGKDLQYAEERIAWRKFMSRNRSFKSDYDKYNAHLDTLKSKYGNDSDVVKWFERTYTQNKFTEEYYEDLGASYSENEKLNVLIARRNAIINAIKPQKGYVQPNLDNLSPEAWDELKNIELEIMNLEDNGYESFFSNVATKEYVNKYQNGTLTSKSYYHWLELSYRSRGMSDEFYNKYFINIGDKKKALSVFLYTSPKHGKISERRGEGVINNYIEYGAPSGYYTTEDSDFLDDQFDPNNPEYIQLDESNVSEKWQKIQKNPQMKAFYDAIVSTMQEACDIIGLDNIDPMQLPQIRDTTVRLFTRWGGRSMAAAWNNTTTINELDTEYNEQDEPVRPDGSKVQTPPLRWLSRLDRQLDVSTDILHTVTMFYEMALNYREKKEFSPMAETFLLMMQGGLNKLSNQTRSRQQADRFLKLIEMYVYDKKKKSISQTKRDSAEHRRAESIAQLAGIGATFGSIMGSTLGQAFGGFFGGAIGSVSGTVAGGLIGGAIGATKIGDKVINYLGTDKNIEYLLSKGTAKAKAVAHILMMGHNLRGVFKNLIDSETSGFAHAISGKYFSRKSYLKGKWEVFKELFWDSNCNKVFGIHPFLQSVGGAAIGGMAGSFLGPMGMIYGTVAGATLANPVIRKIGTTNTRTSWVSAAMSFNGASENVATMFKGHNQYLLRRIVDRFMSMGEYNLIDYTSKGAVTAAVYDTYRLLTVENPDTGDVIQKFVNQELAEYMYVRAGLTKKEGRKAWNKAKTTLKDAYYVDENGTFTLKDKYLDVVRPIIPGTDKRDNILETRVRKTIQDRSSVINGMLGKDDLSSLSQLEFGRQLMFMRGWMVEKYWDLYGTGDSFGTYKKKHEVDPNSDSSKVVKVGHDSDLVGYYDFNAGISSNGLYRGLTSALCALGKALLHLKASRPKTEMARTQKQSLMFSVGALAMTGILIIAQILSAAAVEDDEDSIAKQMALTITTASITESAANLPVANILTAIEIIKQPFVGTSIFQYAGNAYDAAPCIYNYGMYKGGFLEEVPSSFDEVKRGSFKGRIEAERASVRAETFAQAVLGISTPILPVSQTIFGIQNDNGFFDKIYWNENMQKNMTKEGNISAQNFYLKLFPNNLVASKPDRGRSKNNEENEDGLKDFFKTMLNYTMRAETNAMQDEE